MKLTNQKHNFQKAVFIESDDQVVAEPMNSQEINSEAAELACSAIYKDYSTKNKPHPELAWLAIEGSIHAAIAIYQLGALISDGSEVKEHWYNFAGDVMGRAYMCATELLGIPDEFLDTFILSFPHGAEVIDNMDMPIDY
jgi:hypothetical protein